MKRKYKLLLIIVCGTIISLALYFKYANHKISIMAIGDSSLSNLKIHELIKRHYQKDNQLQSYNREYVIPGITSSEVYNLLLTNIKNEENIPILQSLHNSQIILLSLGIDELNIGANINIYLYNLENILKTIRKINTENIFLLSLQSDNEKIKDINRWLGSLAKKYDIHFLEIDNTLSDGVKAQEIYQKIIANN